MSKASWMKQNTIFEHRNYQLSEFEFRKKVPLLCSTLRELLNNVLLATTTTLLQKPHEFKTVMAILENLNTNFSK